MIIFGNICLCLAALVYFVPLQKMLNTTPNLNGTYAGVGILLSIVFVAVPLWLCLTSALFATTARGGFDWLFANRLPQYVVAALASVAIMVATAYSLLGRFVTAPEMSASVRWLSIWAAHVFPLVVMIFCVVVLNARFFPWLPMNVVRIPLVIVSVISALVSDRLLVERTLVHPQRPAAGQAETNNQK